MMDNVHQAILDLAVEDSYALWEIVWRLRHLFPARPETEVRCIAHQAVQELIASDLIQLLQLREPDGEELPLPAHEVEETLADERCWQAPPDYAPQIRILATEAGERTYYTAGAD